MGVTRTVASFVRNTPAISRKSYIAPCLFKLFDDGRLQVLWEGTAGAARGLRQRESRLGQVLAAAGAGVAGSSAGAGSAVGRAFTSTPFRLPEKPDAGTPPPAAAAPTRQNGSAPRWAQPFGSVMPLRSGVR